MNAVEDQRLGAAEDLITRRIDVMGLRLMDLSQSEILERIWRSIELKEKVRVVNANAYMFNLAWSRPWLRRLFEEAEISFFDGVGAQLAALVLRGRMPQRTTPPQWLEDIIAGLAVRQGSMYWLGGRPDIIDIAMHNLAAKDGVALAGYHHGYFDIDTGSLENEQIVQHINRVKPDILFLCMGMPLQELWLLRNWRRLNVPVVITAGALVDHVAGRVKRPPQWMSNVGLEWFVRLCREPRRLWRRYIIGLPIFGFHILSELIAPHRWEDEADGPLRLP